MIDWRDHPPNTASARPHIDPVRTLLSVDTIRVQEGPHAGSVVDVTRTFRSWSHVLDGDHHVHAWAEAEGLGFVYNEAANEWAQYELGPHCARLPRHDARGRLS